MRLAALILLLISVEWVCIAAPPRIELATVSHPADAASPEGMWRFGTEGAIFEVKATAGVDGSFELILEESPDLSLSAGTPFGTMKWTGSGRNYEASIYADPAGRASGLSPRKIRRFILTLSADGSSLAFKPYKKGKNINLLRWLPYLVRVSVSETDTRPRDVDGATRLYPPTASK